MPKRPAASQSGPPAYEELASCTFLGRQRIRLSPDEVPVCQCKPCCQGGSGCGDDCQNRHTNHECHPEYCACAQDCQNQQVQQQRCVKTRLQHMGDKGWGLVALQPVKAGSFVIEYIGEVVSADQAAERSAAYHQEEQPHTYFMNLSPLEIIDATRKGNRARFINHSCQPNCETQKWMVDGETCICIFALRDIAVGEELTYNYHLQWGGGKRIRCHCGAAKCQGYLEADSAQNRAALLMEADSGLDDAGYPLVDPCLETYDSDQDDPFASAGAGSAPFSQSLLAQQAEAPAKFCSLGNPPHETGIQSIMLGSAGPSMHSPDASATLTGRNGSGPCSDASDLTSSHPSDLPIHPHKRIKLSSVQPAQVTAGCDASAQHAPHPNFSTWSATAEAFAQTQGLPQAGRSLNGGLPRDVLFPGSLSPPSVGQNSLGKLIQQAGDRGTAPSYTPCIIPGLTAAQEVVKAEQEAQLAETLRRQENMFVAGYEMDDFGELQLPHGQYTRMPSMKVVFAQRWQHEAQAALPAAAAAAAAAPLSMKQLLDEAVQLDCEQALCGDGLLHHGGAQLPSQLGTGAPVADGKPPIRFKLSEVKNAMRKAESSGPETSSTSSGKPASTASDVRHAAWQVEQLSNTPLLNNLWVEYHIDRCNAEFDDSYWSMLENLST